MGYTSDQSDIVKKVPAKQRRRDPMPASAPVHTSPRYSLLSSERITFSNQSGEGAAAGEELVVVLRGLGHQSACLALGTC